MSSNSSPNVSPNPEDKDSWVDIGNDYEHDFVDTLAPQLDLDARINPEKETNPYAIDLVVDGKHTDLKHQTTPFFTAEDKFSLDPQYTVTFNTNDYERYKEKLNHTDGIDILFWVSWDAVENYGASVDQMEGIWKVSMTEIIEMVESGQVESHKYMNRRAESRNATASYGLDLREMTPVLEDGIRYYSESDLPSVAGVAPGEHYCFPEYIARIESVSMQEEPNDDELWEWPVDERDELAEEVVIEYTKHPFVCDEAGVPAVDDDESEPSRVTAAGWERLDESLDFTQISPSASSGGAAPPADD